MSQPVDIHTILEKGYFSTSGGKISPPPTRLPSSPPSPTPPSPPKHTTLLRDRVHVPAIEPRVPRFRPPPPTVEDEGESLEREFRGAAIYDDATPDDHVRERGEVNQCPVLVEVHEHNPERRFVLLSNSSDSTTTTAAAAAATTPSRPGSTGVKKKTDGATTPTRSERPSAPSSKLSPTAGGDTEQPPPLERKRSRQDLPSLDTDMRQPPVPEHHRTQSAAGPRPTSFSARPSVPVHDEMPSPDVTSNGLPSRREKAYYSADPYPISDSRRLATQRSYSNLVDDRHRDRPQRQESMTPAPGGRSESTPDPRKLRRRVSNDQMSDASYAEESAAARASRRENPYYRREAVPAATASSKPMGPRPRKESMYEEPVLQPRTTTTRRRDDSASIHQDTLPPIPAPVPVPIVEREKGLKVEAKTRSRRSSVSRSTPPPPPTSDEHHLYSAGVPTGRAGRSPVLPTQTLYSKSSPELVPGSPAPRSPESVKTTIPPGSPSKTGNWPPKFDPERDHAPVEQDVGYYRRFSEGRDTNGIPVLPDCQRREPVAGKMDWLTLPRSDMNICPDCYRGVFENTEFRTHFQPMLRPADRPIACDFGSTPWYRIAWLLSLKNDHPDLRLLQQVDSTANKWRGSQPCPGPRPTSRGWLTIWDPYTRRPIPNFTVCYECAAMVEVLLPNLEGIFAPLDPRQEPLTSVCALHFKPQRKRFALYFDALETTADRAAWYGEPPDIEALAAKIDRLSAVDECREGKRIPDTHWYTMQFLPEFTVCADCFDAVVRPRLATDTVARNFFKNPQWVASAACQLYSERMREVFAKACRRNDPKYLQSKVHERRMIEADINEQLAKLDRIRHEDPRADQQFETLIHDWKKWE
ncbi:Conserved hypothetical, protein [Geosmithia morbida]|uniref:Conserved hypothetical, protein n=1 Tax=Geosmithia morbida TaxID=1094350 RepID=A0A9P4YQC9_9HYPO|nr:Conserved hypothetical, protein [Geosmithia morbida]KAF4119696.1 Conserved hypothetical, protein [Geosmithia morbida]